MSRKKNRPTSETDNTAIGDALVDGQSVRGFITHGGEYFVFPLPDGGYCSASRDAYSDFVPLVVTEQPARPTDWPRGTIAIVTKAGGDTGKPDSTFRAVRLDDFWAKLDEAGGTTDADIVRPLVTIDPADARDKIAGVLRNRMGGAVEAWFDYAEAIIDRITRETT